jgi:hypothetical protein
MLLLPRTIQSQVIGELIRSRSSAQRRDPSVGKSALKPIIALAEHAATLKLHVKRHHGDKESDTKMDSDPQRTKWPAIDGNLHGDSANCTHLLCGRWSGLITIGQCRRSARTIRQRQSQALPEVQILRILW